MKAMKLVICVLVLVLALPALAQYTTVTGTATSSAVDLTGAITATLNLTVANGPVTTATLRLATVEVLN